MGSSPSTRTLDSVENAVGSDEYLISVKFKHYKYVCTTCARNNKHSDANIYCKLCKDFLCFRCLLWHSKYKEDHVEDMVGQIEMQKFGAQESPVMPSEKCLAHDGDIVNMFCLKDKVKGCHRCMEEQHKLCVSIIPRSTLQIEGGNNQIKIMQREDNDSKLQNDGQVSGKLRRNYQSVYDGQAGRRKHSPISIGSRVDIMNDLNKQKLRVDDDDIDDDADDNNDADADDDDNDDVDNEGESNDDDDQVSGIKNQHTGLYSIGSNTDVNISLEKNWCCDIIDMCLLSDGRILLSDYNTRKIKLLDISTKKVHQFDIKSQYGPLGVSMLNDTEAVVAVDDNIRVVSIEGKEEMNRTIEMDHYCRGVIYSGKELYVSDERSNIYVYTVLGEKLFKFNTGLKIGGFGFEWLTIGNNESSRLYMTNWKNGIVCLDRHSGEIIWMVDDTDDNGYRGICEDRHNNVFVCRYEKNDVVQFSPDGQLTGVVIDKSEGLELPQSICLDEFMGKIIVGMRSNDVIKIFDLKS